MVQVIWTQRALMQLEQIRDYISGHSRSRAEQFCTRLAGATRSLAEFPRSGHVVQEFEDESIREIPFYPYRIIYKLTDDRCYVTVIIHGSRDLRRHESPDRWEYQ